MLTLPSSDHLWLVKLNLYGSTTVHGTHLVCWVDCMLMPLQEKSVHPEPVHLQGAHLSIHEVLLQQISYVCATAVTEAAVEPRHKACINYT